MVRGDRRTVRTKALRTAYGTDGLCDDEQRQRRIRHATYGLRTPILHVVYSKEDYVSQRQRELSTVWYCVYSIFPKA